MSAGAAAVLHCTVHSTTVVQLLLNNAQTIAMFARSGRQGTTIRGGHLNLAGKFIEVRDLLAAAVLTLNRLRRTKNDQTLSLDTNYARHQRQQSTKCPVSLVVLLE